MPINRGPFNALVDDDNDPGTPLQGTVWNKQAIKDVLLDPIDALIGAWVDVPYASLTFTAGAGLWTVDAADLGYLRYTKIGNVLFIRGAILNTTVTVANAELRMTIPPGLTVAGRDAFGFAVVSVDSFATQDAGQAIARVANNWIAFKLRAGTQWPVATNAIGVIFNMVIEVA